MGSNKPHYPHLLHFVHWELILLVLETGVKKIIAKSTCGFLVTFVLQKSSVYTCNVAHRSTSVRVEVVNRSAIPICRKELAWDLEWPETAPGSTALLDCPPNFVGPSVSRICAMKNATTPEWQVADFSACLYEPLVQPYNSVRTTFFSTSFYLCTSYFVKCVRI